MKTLRRPMFRKGGNVGTGVMTGIVDRGNYANGDLVLTGMKMIYKIELL